MLYATIHNTSDTDYHQNGVYIGAGETLYVTGNHVVNMRVDSDGFIYHIDLGSNVHNPWSNAGHSNVPRHVPGASNGSGGEGLLLTVWMPQEHLNADNSYYHLTN